MAKTKSAAGRAKPPLLEALSALVALVEGVQPPGQLPKIFLISRKWLRQFEHLDAAVEQHCKLLGVSIDPGPKSRNDDDIIAGTDFGFRGATGLKFRLLTEQQADEVLKLDAARSRVDLRKTDFLDVTLCTLANRSDWLRRMEVLAIKSQIATSPVFTDTKGGQPDPPAELWDKKKIAAECQRPSVRWIEDNPVVKAELGPADDPKAGRKPARWLSTNPKVVAFIAKHGPLSHVQ